MAIMTCAYRRIDLRVSGSRRTGHRTDHRTRPRLRRPSRYSASSAIFAFDHWPNVCQLPPLGGPTFLLHALEDRRSVELQPDPDRYHQQHDRREGKAHASPNRQMPLLPSHCGWRESAMSAMNRPSVAVVWIHECSSLPLVGRRMLGNVNGRARHTRRPAPGPAPAAARSARSVP